MTILYFILGLGLLIFIHELGHFLVAKFSGIRVERFSLGFGPHLGFKVGETEYCISLLPLGGYVKMSGQEDFGEGEIVPLDDPRAFSSKSLWTRVKVVLAGPVMNLLLPFLLMPLVFMIGRQEPKYLQQVPVVMGVQADSPAAKAALQKGDVILTVNGKTAVNWDTVLREMAKPVGSEIHLQVHRGPETFETSAQLAAMEGGMGGYLGIEPIFFVDVDPIIGGFTPDSPAHLAGMQVNDKVLAVNGVPISDWAQMAEQVNESRGKPITFTVDRSGSSVELKVAPIFNTGLKKYVIGVSKGSNPDLFQRRAYGPLESFRKGVHENFVLFGMTFKVLKDLVTLKASYKELGGPVRIAQISAKAAKQGLGNFLYLLAFLSIQLGVLNLLPIPVLDGGHLLFMAYEAVAGHALSMRKRLLAQQIGMFLLLTLMVMVTVNDIDAVWGFREIFDKVKGWF
ncbi:MAG TPA: RIP metalloprotease RseP [Deltaproteobacteria bacterium]|nr:RIP metalloprotease RseP [Deltaproteobacteria bacterium]